MFRRRNPFSFWQRARRWVWPDSGWHRAGRYVAKRITRLPGTPHSIAAGFACGVAISFTPFIGFHLLGAALLSLLFRGNFIAAWIGTLVGNPWTFPFIWVLIYNLGVLLLGGEVAHATTADAWTLETMIANLERVIWPMTVGGLPLAVVAGFAAYMPMLRAVAAFQKARRLRREHTRAKRARRLGGMAGTRAHPC